MSTLSPRFGLYLPTDSDIVNIDPINSNSFQLDESSNITPFTGSTYPSPTYSGQLLYRRDTKTLFRADSSGILIPYFSSNSGAPKTLVNQFQSAPPLQSGGANLLVTYAPATTVQNQMLKLSIVGTLEVKNNGGIYNINFPRVNAVLTFNVDGGSIVPSSLTGNICSFSHYLIINSGGSVQANYLSYDDEVVIPAPSNPLNTYSVWLQFFVPDSLTSGSPMTFGMAQGSPYQTSFSIKNLGIAGTSL